MSSARYAVGAWVLTPGDSRKQVANTAELTSGQRLYFFGGGSAWAGQCRPADTPIVTGEATRCVHGTNPPSMCEHCGRAQR